MTAPTNRPIADSLSMRPTMLQFVKHRWPLLLIVLLGVTMAAIVLSLTVLNHW